MFIISVILAIVCGWVLSKLVDYYQSPLRHVPGPRGSSWLFGSFLDIVRRPPYMPQLDWAHEFGGVFVYRTFFTTLKVFVTDPTALRRMFIKNGANYVKPPQLANGLAEVVGTSVLTTEHREHERQRKGVSPAFHYLNLRSFVPVHCAQTRGLIAMWKSKAVTNGGQTVYRADNMHEDLSKLTLDIIGLTAFGYTFNAVDDPNSPLYAAYETLFLGAFTLTNPRRWLPGYGYLPVPANLRLWRAKALLDKTVDDVIDHGLQQEREKAATAATDDGKAKHANNGANGGNDDDDNQKQSDERRRGRRPYERIDLLSQLMQAKTPDGKSALFTKQELRDNTYTFLLAGHETTGTTLSWTLHLLSQHQAVVEKLRAQLASVLGVGAARREVTYEDFAALPYLEAVIHESMRLYPAAPITPRQALADDELGGVRVPAGTYVFTSSGVMGRLRRFWGDTADEFVPERFIDEETGAFKPSGGATHKYAWFPFIAGAHMCIGQRFASLELSSILTELIPAVDVRPVPGAVVRPKLAVTLRPHPRLPLDVVIRS